jgi:NADPH oxidase
VTPFEIIGAISIYIIVVAMGSIEHDSGGASQLAIFIGVIIACRYNLLQLLMGISWERALLFHKVLSMSSIIAGIVHGVYNLIPSSATEVYQSPILFSGVSLLVLMSLQPIMYVFLKSYWFEGFYYSHILVYIVMTYAAVQHNASLILFSTIIWAVDMIVRYILTSRKVMIHIKTVTSDIIMVSIDRKMNYRAGQYIFLMIPSLGVLQWHPFSISSSPHDEKVTTDVYNLW